MKKLTFVILLFFAKNSLCQIQIADTLPKNLHRLKSDKLILTSPSNYEKGYQIKIDSIKYLVTLNNQKVNFISTLDTSFTTSDGISVGTTIAMIRPESVVSKVYHRKGWGNFIKLRSGWYACFSYKTEVSANSKILFLFKK